MADDLEGVLADPARLPTADRAALRDHLSRYGRARGVGGEVFLQAEAIFGGAEVTPAEFASWLHFAAKATGHDAYADRIAAAGPGMPWRTVWAWWRPAHWFPVHPSPNGDYFRVRRCVAGDRHLVESVHGTAVVETDADALRDWPRGAGLDPTSAEEPPPGPAPAVRRPTGPLTAARVDDAFGGARHVVRIAESDLPEGLTHAGSRRYLRDVGLA